MTDSQDNSRDRRLAGLAAAGDQEAFADLVRRYETRIVNFVRASGTLRDEAEDIAQEVFVRAYRGLRTFRGDSSFRSWLYTIATNTLRSAAASRARRPDGAPAPAEDGSPTERKPLVAASDDIEATMIRREAIDHALAALPDEWREAVVLRDIEGLDYREIAAVLGVPLGTVESRIFRARRRLAIELALFAPARDARTPAAG